ncbi:hypothetical protein B566_EDAN011514 [Ephemera danica]|nr:hypothetical protein B566_EDAN011514 [Ephemera danica]
MPRQCCPQVLLNVCGSYLLSVKNAVAPPSQPAEQTEQTKDGTDQQGGSGSSSSLSLSSAAAPATEEDDDEDPPPSSKSRSRRQDESENIFGAENRAGSLPRYNNNNKCPALKDISMTIRGPAVTHMRGKNTRMYFGHVLQGKLVSSPLTLLQQATCSAATYCLLHTQKLK